MGRGNKKGRIKHYQPDHTVRNSIDAYTKEFSIFCDGKTYSQIIDNYCKAFKEANKKKFRRQYNSQEINLIFTTNKEENELVQHTPDTNANS